MFADRVPAMIKRMLRPCVGRARWIGLLVVAAANASCQLIFGLEDTTLHQPSANDAGGDVSTDVVGEAQQEGSAGSAGAGEDADGSGDAETETTQLDAGGDETDAVEGFVVRVNAGGPTVSVSSGQWQGDQQYEVDGSWWGFVGGQTYAMDAGIADTADPILYQTERFWDHAAGTFHVNVPQGTYTVLLKFAEIYDFSGSDHRKFNIGIEGDTSCAGDFIIAPNYTQRFIAKDISCPGVSVSDGVLDVEFIPIATDSGIPSPSINAIEVSRTE